MSTFGTFVSVLILASILSFLAAPDWTMKAVKGATRTTSSHVKKQARKAKDTAKEKTSPTGSPPSEGAPPQPSSPPRPSMSPQEETMEIPTVVMTKEDREPESEIEEIPQHPSVPWESVQPDPVDEGAVTFVSADVATVQETDPDESPKNYSLASDETLVPTEEERRYLDRLTKDYWDEYGKKCGFGSLYPSDVHLTHSGIIFSIFLKGTTWTSGKVEDRVDSLRVLMDVVTGTEVHVGPGETGSVTQVAIRTRRVTDLIDTTWNPEITSLGVDTVTGEEIYIPDDHRMLVAGASGSGKSWSWRPLIAADVVKEHIDPILIDGKGDEANILGEVIRTAVTPDQIVRSVDELHAEMVDRGLLMRQRKISVWDTSLGPIRHVYIDEGRVVLSILTAHDKAMKSFKGDEECESETSRIEKLLDLSGLGRSRGVVLRWATQYPTTSGDNPGIHKQININLDSRFCLRVKNKTQASVVLDDDAWFGPHEIPVANERFDSRGHGFLGDYKPNLICTWTVDDEKVRSLKKFVEDTPSNDHDRISALHTATEPDASPEAHHLSPAEVAQIIDRTANTLYRRALRERTPMTRRDLHMATDSRYRAQVPNLTDEAIRYNLNHGWFAVTQDSRYVAVPREEG